MHTVFLQPFPLLSSLQSSFLSFVLVRSLCCLILTLSPSSPFFLCRLILRDYPPPFLPLLCESFLHPDSTMDSTLDPFIPHQSLLIHDSTLCPAKCSIPLIEIRFVLFFFLFFLFGLFLCCDPPVLSSVLSCVLPPSSGFVLSLLSFRTLISRVVRTPLPVHGLSVYTLLRAKGRGK